MSELPRRRCRPNHGACEALDHGVEPQRDLGELDGGGVEVDAVDLVQGEVGLHLLQLARVLVGVDALAELVLAALEVLSASWRTASMANAPEPSAGSQTSGSRISAAVVVVPSWSSSSSSACDDDEPGEHLGRVVRRRLLALPAGEPEDEGALLVQHRLASRR